MHYEEFDRRAAHYPPPPPPPAAGGARVSPPPPPFYTSTHPQHPHSPVYYSTAPPPPPPPPAHYGGYAPPHYGDVGGFYDGPPAPSPFVGGPPAPSPSSAHHPQHQHQHQHHHHHHLPHHQHGHPAAAHHAPSQVYEPKMMMAAPPHHHHQQQQQQQQPYHSPHSHPHQHQLPHSHHPAAAAPVPHHSMSMGAGVSHSDRSGGPASGSLITAPVSSTGDQQPTYVGYIKSSTDAILLLSACDLPSESNTSKSSTPLTHAPLPPPRRVTRRLLDAERADLVASGSVFVWDEKEAGMKRWTDGRVWSASRVSGCFLTYRELEARKKTNPSSSLNGHHDGPTSNQYKPEGLIKQSFSITTASGRKLHVISYFTKRDVREGRLRRVSEDPRFVGEGGGEWGLQIDEAEYSFPDLGGGGSHDGQVAAQLEADQPSESEMAPQQSPHIHQASPYAPPHLAQQQPVHQRYSSGVQMQQHGRHDDEVSLGSRSSSPHHPAVAHADSSSRSFAAPVPVAAPAGTAAAAPSRSRGEKRKKQVDEEEDEDEDDDDLDGENAHAGTRPTSYFRAETNSTKRAPVRPKLVRGRSNSMSASMGNSRIDSHRSAGGSSSAATNDGRTSFQSNTSFATTVSTGEGVNASEMSVKARYGLHSPTMPRESAIRGSCEMQPTQSQERESAVGALLSLAGGASSSPSSKSCGDDTNKSTLGSKPRLSSKLSIATPSAEKDTDLSDSPNSPSSPKTPAASSSSSSGSGSGNMGLGLNVKPSRRDSDRAALNMFSVRL